MPTIKFLRGIKKRKKFGVHRQGEALITRRNSLVVNAVAQAITTYLKGDKIGVCLVCNTTFEKSQRYHCICDSTCYKTWTRGMIRPRSET